MEFHCKENKIEQEAGKPPSTARPLMESQPASAGQRAMGSWKCNLTGSVKGIT